MENLSGIKLGPLPQDSPYCKPYRLYYVQNGVEKNWDLLKVHDSVIIIIYHKEHNSLVFVKQFRPAVYFAKVNAQEANFTDIDVVKYPASLGITIELCAGIVDKSLPLKEIAKEEILEECGYNVPIDRIEEVLSYRSGVGTNGAAQTMYYCEITEADKDPNSGGGVDGEIIEIVEHSIEELRDLLKSGSILNSVPSFLFGVMWFLYNKAPKCSELTNNK